MRRWAPAARAGRSGLQTRMRCAYQLCAPAPRCRAGAGRSTWQIWRGPAACRTAGDVHGGGRGSRGPAQPGRAGGAAAC
eukprot:7176070-Lingulodinium_polyedra.AAC.1